ncbi:MAG TPA: hypothetical protein VFB74_14600, partial [Kribbellaceae bacterium]|nr:hypothetical protein [Kribbellaceae bacterium]
EDGGQDELARLYALLNDTSLPVDGEAGLSWWSDSDLLAAAAVGSGSTKGVLVGDTRIELVTSSVSTVGSIVR